MGGGISNYHENIVLPLQAATTVFIAAAIIGFIREEATDVLNLARRPNLGTNALPRGSADCICGSEATPSGRR